MSPRLSASFFSLTFNSTLISMYSLNAFQCLIHDYIYSVGLRALCIVGTLNVALIGVCSDTLSSDASLSKYISDRPYTI